MHVVGERWASGQLHFFEENFLSQQLIQFINSEITRLPTATDKPKVLLATLPGEEHTLDLLMVSAIQYNHIRDDLQEMRDLMPDGVDIWIGGEGVRRLRKLPTGVTKFMSLEKLPF